MDWAQVPAGSCAGVPAGVPYWKAAGYAWDPSAEAGPDPGAGQGGAGCASSPAAGAPAFLLLALPWLARRRATRRLRPELW